MKKIILSIFMLLTLCSCGQVQNTSKDVETETESQASISDNTFTPYLSEETETNKEENKITLTKSDLDEALKKFQGEYKNVEEPDEEYIDLVISDTDIVFVSERFEEGMHYCSTYDNYISFDSEGNLVVFFPNGSKRYNISLEDDILKLYAINEDSRDMVYTKVSENTEIPPQRSKPEINMTKDEIINTTWADLPAETGFLTTENGTTEIWYYEWGVIYFYNDKVIMIENADTGVKR